MREFTLTKFVSELQEGETVVIKQTASGDHVFFKFEKSFSDDEKGRFTLLISKESLSQSKGDLALAELDTMVSDVRECWGKEPGDTTNDQTDPEVLPAQGDGAGVCEVEREEALPGLPRDE